MIKRLPAFRLGEHYRELSPEEGDRRWRWVTTKPVTLELDFPAWSEEIAFLDGRGIERAVLVGSRWTMHPGYAWNGCSPKRWLPFLGWIGTPDTPDNLPGSVWHDLGCQFVDTGHFPLSRAQVDELFGIILRKTGFAWAGLYSGAVKDFGPLFKGPGDGSRSILIERPKGAATGAA